MKTGSADPDPKKMDRVRNTAKNTLHLIHLHYLRLNKLVIFYRQTFFYFGFKVPPLSFMADFDPFPGYYKHIG